MRNLKQILHTIIDIILLYISGLACSYGFLIGVGFIFSILLNWLCKIFLPSPVTPHAYDDFIGGTGLLFVTFVCIPIGAIMGILMADNLILKQNKMFLFKVIISLLIAILFSAVIFWFVLLILKYDVFLFDVRRLFFVFVCIPLGVITGILITDKLILKQYKIFSLRIIISLLMAILGSAVMHWVQFYSGTDVPDWLAKKVEHIPCGYASFYIITSVFLSLIGYNITGLFRRSSTPPKDVSN